MKKATIKDIARVARVSLQTVSRVVNGKSEISDETRARVQKVIQELGYRPNQLARGLATKRTGLLGLVIPDITNPFFPEVVLGAEKVALEKGYSVILCNTGEDETREQAALRLLEDKSVDGIIIFSPRMPDSLLVPLLKHHKAVVLINRQSPASVAGVLRIDHDAGLKLAIRHLAGRAHIGYLAGPKNSRSGVARLKSIHREIRKLGDRTKLYVSSFCAPNFEGGFEAAHELLVKYPKIDALISYNDIVAIGAMQACANLKRSIPEDVAIVGHDDILFARYVAPSLTTLRLPAYEIGRTAIQLLVDRISDKPSPSEIVITPVLVTRASS
jgi:LacI family transcriptional regulator